MTISRHPPGTTLVELLFALAILAILIGIAAPPLRRWLDRYATVGAREALAAGVARARSLAVGQGGAALVVDVGSGRFWVRAGGDVVEGPVDLGAQYRVELTVDGAAADRVVLRFDARGLGRLANRTFRLRRGDATAGLTLSTYGRPRRW
ncbi:MAG TPA: hypothetical protein VF188_18155 [Longimicrobiales bacterium]